MKKLFVCCVAIGFVFALGNFAMAATWSVPGDFDTIQLAINSADDGDTIEVEDGTYDEEVWVTKELTIQAASGSAPVIDGGGSRSGLIIVANNVNIIDLTVKNAVIAIGINGTTNSYITGNSLEGNLIGIGLYNTDTNTLQNNTISYSAYQGIYAIGSSYNTIKGNNIFNNQIGIQLDLDSNNNSITNNSVDENDLGIKSNDNNTNSLVSNSISSNMYQGVYLLESISNTIKGNAIINNQIGIQLDLDSNNNSITNNSVDENDLGIKSNDNNTNAIERNSISSNTYQGIFVVEAGGYAHYNNIQDNGTGIANDTTTIIFDATSNWWGHASGPSGPDGRLNKKGKVIGKGDSIYGNVEWVPYLPQPVGHTKHDPVPPGLLR